MSVRVLISFQCFMKVVDITKPSLVPYIFLLRNNRHGQQNNFPILQQLDSHSVLEYCSKLNFLTHNLVCALCSGKLHVGHPLSIIIFFSEKSLLLNPHFKRLLIAQLQARCLPAFILAAPCAFSVITSLPFVPQY